MFTRRSMMLASGATMAVGVTGIGRAAAAADFVRRDGVAFRIGGERYHYAGTNMWYGAWLGADASHGIGADVSLPVARSPR